MKVSVKEMTLEERDAISKNIYSEALFFLTSIYFDKMGPEEAMETIRPAVRMSSHAFSINMHLRFGIEGTDIERIADVSQLMEVFSGAPFLQSNWGSQDVEISSKKIIRAGYVNCLNISGNKEFCKWAHEGMINAICEAINPEYECRFTQMITNGDPICSYTIEKKRK